MAEMTLDDQMSAGAQWWLCPNRPRCPHPAVLHDVEDWEDTSPRCCVDECTCGKRTVYVKRHR